MSKCVLYSQEVSPPCRSVLWTAEVIGLPLEIRTINLLNKENLNKDFVKKNPQHTIPALEDNGFFVWDSHAIMTYLVEKYAKDDSLYPKDLQKRALINQRLHFDSGVVFNCMKNAFRSLIFHGETSVPKEKLDTLEEAVDMLEKFLGDAKWMAGDSYTLADICLATSVSGLTVLCPLDKYPKLKAWLKRCEEHLPGYKKVNVPGNNELHALVRSKLS